MRDGDQVHTGDLLVELSDARMNALLASLRPLLQINLAQRARLIAERSGAQKIDWPDELTQSSLSEIKSIISEQQKMFDARRNALESRRASPENQREQALALAAGLEERIETQDERIELTRIELTGIASLAAIRTDAPRTRAQPCNRGAWGRACGHGIAGYKRSKGCGTCGSRGQADR